MVRADYRDRTVVRFAPQHLRSRKPRCASANDHNRGRAGNAGRTGGGWVDFLADGDAIALALDTPARDRIECRRAHRLAGLQAETRVVPRTPNGPVGDYAVGKRAVIVGAVGADSKDVV